ncbi:MAG: PLDc N-terminal domain-containing protein [Ginsengibacter sp.]|jgi:glucan phosphoethanolaminetransferase (alkaline phosphatase superfamily)
MELLLPQLSIIVWLFFIIVPFCLFLLAIIDILRNQFKGANTKLIWILVVLLLPFLGSILYFLIGRKDKIEQAKYIVE